MVRSNRWSPTTLACWSPVGTKRVWRRIWQRLRRFWVVLMNLNGRNPPVDCRLGHVAVTHGHRIIIWGGYHRNQTEETQYYRQRAVVYSSLKGQWRVERTHGQVPPGTSGSAAAVVDNAMFLVAGFVGDAGTDDAMTIGNVDSIYRLNLGTFEWTKLEPEGQSPIPSDKLVAWAYDDCIYVFGGFGENVRMSSDHAEITLEPLEDPKRGWNDQFVRLNIARNAWEWPRCLGERPTPRAAHAIVISGPSLFLFGGRNQNIRLNDLYHLDMTTLAWTCLCRSNLQSDISTPCGRSWHSLTLADQDSAVLYGGLSTHNEVLNDCWRLDLSEPRNIVKQRWTRLGHYEDCLQQRLWHQAVLESESEQIWLLGGSATDILNYHVPLSHPNRVERLAVRPSSLMYLAACASAKNFDQIKKALAFIPQHLQCMVTAKTHGNHLHS